MQYVLGFNKSVHFFFRPPLVRSDIHQDKIRVMVACRAFISPFIFSNISAKKYLGFLQMQSYLLETVPAIGCDTFLFGKFFLNLTDVSAVVISLIFACNFVQISEDILLSLNQLSKLVKFFLIKVSFDGHTILKQNNT